jgi:hypothetical protein
MPQHIKSTAKLHTDHALLALLGAKFQQSDFFAPVRNLVHIQQKTVLHQPTDKLLDCLLGMLAGNVALYQSNTNVLGDTALQKAFGRTSCADQSTIQRTLDATTPENVQQLQHALALIFGTYSRTAKYDFSKSDLIVDLDMTAIPCSKAAQAACPGYFAGCKKGTSGRQLLRLSASQYDEIIYQQVLPGNAVCHDLALLQLVLTALWQILQNCVGSSGTTAAKARIILRLDGGFGTAAIVNYLLAEGYQVVVKQFNGLRSQKRATELAEAAWLSESETLASGKDKDKVDPATSENGRQFALLTDDGFYELGERKLWQIAVRCPTKPKAKKVKAAPKTGKRKRKRKAKAEVVEAEPKAKYGYTILLVARRELAELEAVQVPALLAAQLEFYDGRAVIESASFRGDKQGLGLAKRRKHSLSGQEFWYYWPN